MLLSWKIAGIRTNCPKKSQGFSCKEYIKDFYKQATLNCVAWAKIVTFPRIDFSVYSHPIVRPTNRMQTHVSFSWTYLVLLFPSSHLTMKDLFLQAGLSLLGLSRLRKAVKKVYGQEISGYFILILCSQFHILFYAGRPLPNTLALLLVCWAVALFLENKFTNVIHILAFTSVSLLIILHFSFTFFQHK